MEERREERQGSNDKRLYSVPSRGEWWVAEELDGDGEMWVGESFREFQEEKLFGNGEIGLENEEERQKKKKA